MNGSLKILLAVAMAIGMSVASLGPVAAHESSALDTNTVLGQTWDLFGPGGPAEDDIQSTLEPLGFYAAEAGGECTDSTSHDYTGEHPTCPDSDTLTPSFYQCDGLIREDPTYEIDIQAIPKNPFFHSDVENGIFEATGTFFVDAEFEGRDADKVDQIWFFYAETFPWPASSSLCNGPFPEPGAYGEFITGDTDGSDGWEIPVNTLQVPDAPYGAGIRAFDENLNVLMTAFVYANVNNYLNDLNFQPGTPATCDQSNSAGQTLCPYHDRTPPWPVVKGALGHVRSGNAGTHCADGVAFEFGEPLGENEDGTLKFSADTGSWESFPSTERDVETVPLFTTATEAFGPSFCVTGAIGDITITAEDQSGNVAKRTVPGGSICQGPC